jgi:glycosyltransferase involved in cell wall biosynthesis
VRRLRPAFHATIGFSAPNAALAIATRDNSLPFPDLSSVLLLELSVVNLLSMLVFAAVQTALVVSFLRALSPAALSPAALSPAALSPAALSPAATSPAATSPVSQPPTAESQPKVAVILCLRGSDPFLADCLQAILHQDYPSYDLHIIIDHPGDPSRRIVDEALDSYHGDNVFLQFLTERRETCSLKCSSLVQVVSGLDDSYDVMAQLDADTIAHPTWLTELMAPMVDTQVGATTGNRWYMPDVVSWGAMVRWLWNSAAIVQMFSYRIPWGGTLAIKMDVVRQSNLLDKWSHAFCEDTMLASFLKQRGQRVEFVPSLLMVNRESCGLKDFSNWVSRQLLTARLYHASWPLVAGHALLSSGLMLAAIVQLAIGIAAGRSDVAILNACGLVVFQGSNFALLWRLEVAVLKLVGRRGETRKRYTLIDMLKLPIAVSLTQIVYAAALSRAIFTRAVSWRGATYEIRRDKSIHLVRDEQYLDQPASGDQDSL